MKDPIEWFDENIKSHSVPSGVFETKDGETLSVIDLMKRFNDTERKNMEVRLIDKIMELRKNADDGKSRWLHPYEDAPTESQNEIEGYMWALNDVVGLLDEL